MAYQSYSVLLMSDKISERNGVSDEACRKRFWPFQRWPSFFFLVGLISFQADRICSAFHMPKQFKTEKQKDVHSRFTSFAQRPNRADSNERNGTGERSLYSLEYSPNFQRHIVRSANDNEVVESFLWLDEALLRYPSSKVLPFQWPITQPDGKVVNASVRAEESFIKIAGAGIHETTSYSEATYGSLFYESNLPQVKYILESRLQWNLDRVEKLLEAFPELGAWPADLLQERMDFLLTPLPSAKILHQVNHTVVDWPAQFYRHGCGAGLSVEQVSHAMQVMPDILFRLGPFATPNPLVLPFLYTETPAVVIEMACNQLEPLTGASRLDVAAFAYLHWRGLEWEQCRVLMQALPNVVSATTEPNWELYERGGYVRKQLLLDSLWYLQIRLQIVPSHIQAMLKTHSTLSGYSVAKLKRNLDALQEKLGASSAEVQKLVLRMPSLLGISIGGLDDRIQFWTHDVSLTLSQLRQAIQRQPALLQYSLEANLRSKLVFFREDLQMSLVELSRMTVRQPQLWGRSLERSIRPLAESFVDRCGNMTLSEYGRIIVQAPELVLCNWQGNLESKLEFLQSRLGMNEADLKRMVSRTPRVLMQSLSSSLGPKFAMLEEHSVDDGREAIRKNPSLLLNSRKVLKNRIMRVTADSKNISLVNSLCPSAVKRRPKRIWLLDPDNRTVEMEFANALEAATYAQVSKSHMYMILRQGKALSGRRFVYASETLFPKEAPRKPTSSTSNRMGDPLTKDICRCLRMEPSLTHFTIHVAGRAFPPEDVVRGRRRAGGMALRVPAWTANDWRKVCASLWKGQRLRLLSDGQTVLLGYPYILPSRPRCSLYVCREALRVVTEWLTQQPPCTHAVIELVTDSHYVLDLLKNTTALNEWGRHETRADFEYTGPGLVHRVNPDILYPLARTHFHLVVESHRNVTIKFRRALHEEHKRRLGEGARLAAQLMYDSTVRR